MAERTDSLRLVHTSSVTRYELTIHFERPEDSLEALSRYYDELAGRLVELFASELPRVVLEAGKVSLQFLWSEGFSFVDAECLSELLPSFQLFF